MLENCISMVVIIAIGFSSVFGANNFEYMSDIITFRTPEYSAVVNELNSDVKSDITYTFPDGTITVQETTPLMFINGSFTSEMTGIVPFDNLGNDFKLGEIEPREPFIPIAYVIDEMGGETEWDSYNESMTIRFIGHEIKLVVGSGKFLLNGIEETLLYPPIFHNGSVYVLARENFLWMCSIIVFDYIPNFEEPSFTKNPILVIDRHNSYFTQATIWNAKTHLKEQLSLGLKNMVDKSTGQSYESDLKKAAPIIQEEINNALWSSFAYGYVMLKGPYMLLMNDQDGEIYIYNTGEKSFSVTKYDVNDDDLFLDILYNYVTR